MSWDKQLLRVFACHFRKRAVRSAGFLSTPKGILERSPSAKQDVPVDAAGAWRHRGVWFAKWRPSCITAQ